MGHNMGHTMGHNQNIYAANGAIIGVEPVRSLIFVGGEINVHIASDAVYMFFATDMETRVVKFVNDVVQWETVVMPFTWASFYFRCLLCTALTNAHLKKENRQMRWGTQ